MADVLTDAARGVHTLLPSTDDQQRIHATIYDELTRGYNLELVDTTIVHCNALVQFMLEGTS